MRNIYIDHTIFDPANGIWDNYFEFVKARAGNDISEYRSSFTVAEIPHKIKYDRTLNTEASIALDGDITVMSIPTIYDEEKRDQKAKSPFLQTEHTITCTAVLKPEDIDGIDKEAILKAYEGIIVSIVGKYGEPDLVDVRGNDLYYNGKKFGGIECTMGDVMTIGSCITMQYLPDKDMIDCLPGRGNYGITGITEEIPQLTKDVMIYELVSGIRNFFNV